MKKMEKYLRNIDLTKATGSDNIGPRLLKLAALFIAESLTYICNQNQNINISTFPDKWKEGKVRPLHKSGPKDNTTNYRPISVLPVLSKLLEKHVHGSLMTFLISHNALHSTQSGFRLNHSCETALLQMINEFHEGINNGQIIGMVMVDFRKGFDSVEHAILLKNSGIVKSQTKHFSGCLPMETKSCHKWYRIKIWKKNMFCVPQGSILGPLFC